MSKQSKGLPEGWCLTTLGEICLKIVDGSHNPPQKQDAGIPMLSARNISNGKIEFDSFRNISPEDFEVENERTQITTDDVLLTIVGTIGRTAVVPQGMKPFALQRSVAVLKLIYVLPKFCMYQLQSILFQELLANAGKGTAQKGIYLKALSEMPFILAPLDEQKLIVDEIEKQISRIDEAVKSFDRIKINIERLRNTTLKLAFEGKLFSAERELSWEGSSTIHESLPIAEETPDLPNSWKWTNLARLKQSSIYGPRFSSDDYSTKGIAVLRTTDIDRFGRVSIENAPKIELSEEEYEKYKLEIGDLLITRTGSIGTVAVYNDHVKAIPGAFLIHYRLLRSEIIAWYLFYFFISPKGQAALLESSSGGGRLNLNVPSLDSIPIPVPSVAEQTRIVKTIDDNFLNIEKLEEMVRVNSTRLEQLRRKVLQEAFEGKLVEQLSASESAAKLIDKIAVERKRIQSMVKTTKNKKKTMKAKKDRRRIVDVLAEAKSKLRPEQLFHLSGFKPDNVEEFYAELKDAYNLSKVTQEKLDDGTVYLTANI